MGVSVAVIVVLACVSYAYTSTTHTPATGFVSVQVSDTTVPPFSDAQAAALFRSWPGTELVTSETR